MTVTHRVPWNVPIHWELFLMSLALHDESPATADTLPDFSNIERLISESVRSEGGKVIDIWWEWQPMASTQDGMLRPFVLFEARDQVAIDTPAGVDMSGYLRPPAFPPGGYPEALEPEAMAASVWSAINGTGQLLVLELRHLIHSGEFVPGSAPETA